MPLRLFKHLLLLIVSCWIGYIALAQKPTITWQEALQHRNALLQGRGVNNATITTGATFNAGQQQQINQLLTEQLKQQKQMKGSSMAGSCHDSSFRKLIGFANSFVYMGTPTATADGGELVPAEIFDTLVALPQRWWNGYGLLVKLDALGQVQWIQQFDNLLKTRTSNIVMLRVFELANGDIVCTGVFNKSEQSSAFYTVVYRLTSTGAVIWKNIFENRIKVFNQYGDYYTFMVQSATEGLNGDLLLCGTSEVNVSYGDFATIIRLDNKGNLVWDNNFGNHSYDGSYMLGAGGVEAHMENGAITAVALSSGAAGGGVSAISVLKLDYTDGHLLGRRFFHPSYTDMNTRILKSFIRHDDRLVHLNNGHYLVQGKLYSGAAGQTSMMDHFGVVEFDASFNLVRAYTVSSAVKSNFHNDCLYLDKDGKGLVMTYEFIGAYAANQFYGSFSNDVFQHQRAISYDGISMAVGNGFVYFPSGGYSFMQNYYDTATGKSYLEFIKMHNSDTSSVCMGRTIDHYSILPLTYTEDPGYAYLDPPEPNHVTAITNTLSEAPAVSATYTDACSQVSHCDTVKIHGKNSICGNGAVLQFTAYKNPECGARVQWSIPPDAVDSMHTTGDTTVTIWFKQVNWKGTLYASLPASSCGTQPADSIAISIVRAQKRPDLGADAPLCTGNTLTLHAGTTYTSYQWQNGSTDSVLLVSSPGLYWVKVSDDCGNQYADSVTITRMQVSVDIGPDRTRCNSDTIHLDAPAGFINYAWSNNYAISSLTAQQVVVNPARDTSYYLKAEKLPGCFAYDTVHISVFQSPAISLGPDKSFCSGDSARFTAGSGFAQYTWSTGATTPEITAYKAGRYSVMAITAEGCRSYDTVQVSNVYPNPVVMLDKDTALCAGTVRVLDAGNYSNYNWSTGSNSRTIAVTATGMYAVKVTDINGCTASDTTRITSLLPLPSNFLGADTAICSYGSLVLAPLTSYAQYTWSNGAASSSITITQPGHYWLQVTDQHQCSGKDSILVNPKQCMQGVYVPSAFTPNNDGKNDVFRPLLFGNVKQFQFSVFDRWGQLVFQTTELAKGWDGTLNGVPKPGDVFAWVCTYTFEGEEKKVEKGIVVLLR